MFLTDVILCGWVKFYLNRISFAVVIAKCLEAHFLGHTVMNQVGLHREILLMLLMLLSIVN